MGCESIYKLPMGENDWELVNADLLRQETEGDIPIAEHDGTLYIIPSHELFASTDGGKTWNSIGPCPKGHVRELLITEEIFCLSLSSDIFRSDDAGNSWVNLNDGLDNRLIEHDGIGTPTGEPRHFICWNLFGQYIVLTWELGNTCSCRWTIL